MIMVAASQRCLTSTRYAEDMPGPAGLKGALKETCQGQPGLKGALKEDNLSSWL
jgi:hypothetical protein